MGCAPFSLRWRRHATCAQTSCLRFGRSTGGYGVDRRDCPFAGFERLLDHERETFVTPTKFLIGQIFVVLIVAVGGVWFATEWAAWHLGFQSQLGAPWFTIFSVPFYFPWRLFEWWYAYDAYAPELFNKSGAIAATSGFASCGAAIIGSLWRARQSKNVTTYGSSRWANLKEIEKAGLFRSSGVFLGQLGHHYLRHDGPEHVMAFAPTRSGKVSALSCPRCCPGRIASSFTTSKARIGN